MEDAKARYYKLFSLSGISPTLLKNDKLANLYLRPKKEKRSERPKVLVWKVNATQQADLCKMPINRGFKYFLTVVELACQRIDAEPIKNKKAETIFMGIQANLQKR